MATAKQILANRANAAKSTGPKTPAGRASSAQNSLRHGAISRAIVLKGESHRRFCLLLNQLRGEFQPQSPTECHLVENMAAARWRQMRIWALESGGLTHEIEQQAATGQDIDHDLPARSAIAFRKLSDGSHSLHLLVRYEALFERQYSRSLDHLVDLQKTRNFTERTQF